MVAVMPARSTDGTWEGCGDFKVSFLGEVSDAERAGAPVGEVEKAFEEGRIKVGKTQRMRSASARRTAGLA